MVTSRKLTTNGRISGNLFKQVKWRPAASRQPTSGSSAETADLVNPAAHSSRNLSDILIGHMTGHSGNEGSKVIPQVLTSISGVIRPLFWVMSLVAHTEIDNPVSEEASRLLLQR
ncbi:hypothetical protein PoB_004365600 [Plakobranchus ocellatus]|uniref:Uncharacterized protein n=1 Tax=Plakobranchus ocellatus TaxID=259542 RepID=A0AAV4B9M8_9GAST|nr:hypothetical protein PoB_004365600 [Plakobranchus ocellatus]